jgi:O-antigen/teichoic acid export membrane protein
MTGRSGRTPRAAVGGLLRLAPVGTAPVAAGLAVLGVASYVHLAIAGHTLDPAAMSSLAVLWSVVFAIGPGLFFPVEQEIARIVAGLRAHGQRGAAVLRRGAALALCLLAALLFGLLLAGPVLTARLFAGDAGLVWALAGAFAGLAAAHTTRGVFAGTGRFGQYGAQLGLDGALRIGLAVLLGLLGVRSALWFALVLTLAPLASVLLTLRPVRAELLRPAGAPTVGWAALGRGLGLLTVSALLAQVLVNVAVVDIRLLAPADVAIAGAMLAAMVLVRIPLFVFASLQAALLPGLSAAVARGERPAFGRLLGRSLIVVTVLGGLGTVVAVLAGAWLSTRLFDAPPLLGRGDFAALAVGTLAYLWALVLGQGVLALGRHRDQALAWVAGILALIGLTLAPGAVAHRVELGYAGGAFTVAAVLAAMLLRRVPAHWRSAPLAPAVAVPGGPQ